MGRIIRFLFIILSITILGLVHGLPYVRGATPYDTWRPLIAGIKIHGVGDGCPPNTCDRWYLEGSYYASIGFKAYYSGKYGFVTAGHFAMATNWIIY